MIHTRLSGAFLMACGVLAAQEPDSQSVNTTITAATPNFRVTSTAGTAKAFNYRHRRGATKIDFRGTALLPEARGEAKVESKQGYIEIEVEFDGLQPANSHGGVYLTYVLWAISPEGRTANLGEILLNGTKSKLNVTTELQVFGLVVTAEPYYAVSRPSDLIVMENMARADTSAKVEEIDAKYELLQRGQYERLANPLALKLDHKLPLELYEARNAVQIARAVGADRFAAETFQKAEKTLAQADADHERNAGRKSVIMTAREAVQTAEDSRAIAVKRQEEEALTAERQQSVDREALAERGRVAAQAESARLTQENETQARVARAEADRVKRENDDKTAVAGIEAERLRIDNETRAASARTEADRLKVESELRVGAAETEANRLRRENEAQRVVIEVERDSAGRQKERVEVDRATLRTQLLNQFNAVLSTRDTTRGLIVTMSDSLFQTGATPLRPLARERLASVAGIVSGHPGLRLDVEGHTDSGGRDGRNQRLSEQRGEAVREFLTQQGMAASSVTSKGFGETQPMVSNGTAQGRQQNRRVELVISGEAIGTEIGTPIAAR